MNARQRNGGADRAAAGATWRSLIFFADRGGLGRAGGGEAAPLESGSGVRRRRRGPPLRKRRPRRLRSFQPPHRRTARSCVPFGAAAATAPLLLVHLFVFLLLPGMHAAFFNAPAPGPREGSPHSDGCSTVPQRDPERRGHWSPKGSLVRLSAPRIRNHRLSWPSHGTRRRRPLVISCAAASFLSVCLHVLL